MVKHAHPLVFGQQLGEQRVQHRPHAQLKRVRVVGGAAGRRDNAGGEVLEQLRVVVAEHGFALTDMKQNDTEYIGNMPTMRGMESRHNIGVDTTKSLTHQCKKVRIGLIKHTRADSHIPPLQPSPPQTHPSTPKPTPHLSEQRDRRVRPELEPAARPVEQHGGDQLERGALVVALKETHERKHERGQVVDLGKDRRPVRERRQHALRNAAGEGNSNRNRYKEMNERAEKW